MKLEQSNFEILSQDDKSKEKVKNNCHTLFFVLNILYF